MSQRRESFPCSFDVAKFIPLAIEYRINVRYSLAKALVESCPGVIMTIHDIVDFGDEILICERLNS